MAKNILELTTLIDRATVVIDGEAYELINAQELSIVDTYRVGKWGARVQELYGDADQQSEEDIRELASLLDRLCRLLLRAPDEVHDRLNDGQRLAVAMAFTKLQRGSLPVSAGANEAPVPAPTARVEIEGPAAGVERFGTSTGEKS